MRESFLKKHIARIFFGILVIFSLLFFPWWITAFLLIVFMFRFNGYYEVFLAAFIADSLYGRSLSFFFNLNVGFFIGAFISFILISHLKRYLTFPSRI